MCNDLGLFIHKWAPQATRAMTATSSRGSCCTRGLPRTCLILRSALRPTTRPSRHQRCQWPLKAANGCQWAPMATNERQWPPTVPMVTNGRRWRPEGPSPLVPASELLLRIGTGDRLLSGSESSIASDGWWVAAQARAEDLKRNSGLSFSRIINCAHPAFYLFLYVLEPIVPLKVFPFLYSL